MGIAAEIARGAAVMAHCIIYEGVSTPLAVARHLIDGSLTVTPFGCETHTTEFINGTVHIEKSGDTYTVTPLKPSGKAKQL